MKKNNFFTHFKLYLLLLFAFSIAVVSCSNSTNPNPRTGAPNITSVNPIQGPANSTITINGQNFSATTSGNFVTFDNTQATVSTASENKLTVKVPGGLIEGKKYNIRDKVDDKITIAPKRFTVAALPDTADNVPQDGILETVTWNLKLFQGDPGVKINNDVLVVDSLNADLFAFQEILGEDAIDSLVQRMTNYKAVYDKTTNQGNAFVYNTNAIKAVKMGKITMGQNSSDWAGRLPYFLTFTYMPGNGKPNVDIYAVVIHAKAGGGQDDYNRRVAAAQELYNFLTNQKPNANIILLGDYNDKPTTSIYNGEPTPYKPFVDDKTNYNFITLPLAEQGKTSETNFTSVIDNILISNEVVKYYVKGSARVFIPTNDFINNYGETTSDHYPVEAKFDFTR